MSSETSVNGSILLTDIAESESESQPSDWGDHLPGDILDLILNNLLRLSDYRRFGSVCKHWLSVTQTQSHLRLDPFGKQLPLLFIPNTTPSPSQSQSSEPPRTEPESEPEPQVEPGLYDLKARAILHGVKLQWRYHQRCCGSSFGWLATSNMFIELYFTNPFTGRTLKFPSLEGDDLYPDENELTYLTPEELDEAYLKPEEHRVFKAIMSKDPDLFPNDYTVIAIHYDYLRFSLVKPNAKYWVEIENKGLRAFADVIIYKGLVYAVSFFGGLGSIDVSGDFDDDIKSKLQVIVSNHMEYARTAYLVESSQGDLLQVRMLMNKGDYMFIEDETHLTFDVFMLVEDEGKMKWIELENLGEDALFLGDNYSTSILASNFPNICNPNCIYFTNNFYHHGFSYDERNRWFDIGIYNVVDRSFRLHSLMPSSPTRLLPPIWIQPL